MVLTFLTISVLIMSITSVLGSIDFTCPSGNQCISLPNKCTRNCMGTVALTAEDDGTINFVVQTKLGLHTTVALSMDKLMQFSFGVACMEDIGTGGLHRIWTGAARQPRPIPDPIAPETQILKGEIETNDGIITCKFGLKLPITYEGKEFTTDEDIYILIANSPAQARPPFISAHNAEGRAASDFMVAWGGAHPSGRFGQIWKFTLLMAILSIASRIFRC